MKICHVCKAECDDSAELCPICGAELTGCTDAAEENLQPVLENPSFAVSVEDVVTAEIYRDVLKENNIPFTCDSTEQGSMKLLFGGGFSAEDIYVEESDVEKALELYSGVVNSEPSFEEFSPEDESEAADGEE